jgi:hypothetical protein
MNWAAHAARLLPLAALGLLYCAGGADQTLVLPAPDPGPPPFSTVQPCPELGNSAAALSVEQRHRVGTPLPYTADPILTQHPNWLSSQLERRKAAWAVAAKVLANARLSGTASDVTSTELGTWQTWYAKDDLTRVFRSAYANLSPAERASRTPLAASWLEAAGANNDGPGPQDSTTAALESAAGAGFFGGLPHVTYSPAASRHLLSNYSSILDCSDTPRGSSRPLFDDPCAAPRTTRCLREPFPPSSVLVKARWQRADVAEPLVTFDTSAGALARRFATPGGGEWTLDDGSTTPAADAIFTVQLENGNRFWLPALHIMTRELEHWFWISLWWSPEPDSDFGADRPAALPAPWQHYKLCTTIAFEESDRTPSAGPDGPLDLTEALAAVVSPSGSSWCSNPYIEAGPGSASTNCVGCHQHAGSNLRAEDILGDSPTFPDHGRQQVRTEFPADYVFSTRLGDNVGAMLRETEQHYVKP